MFNQDLSCYTKGEKIGQGAFGKVYIVNFIKDYKYVQYAAKVQENVEENPVELKNLIREIKTNAKMNHPAIIKFIGFSSVDFENEERPVIITEYAPNGSLENCLRKSANSVAPIEFDDTQKLIILYGVASAMEYLHQNKILHRDLKPDNILLDDSYNPKICDFGLSKIVNSIDTTNDQVGTALYMSPEIIESNNYTEAGDIYAFGMIAYQLFVNENPFENTPLFPLMSKVKRGERPEITGPVPESYKKLIESCWAQDPNKRPSFETIINQLKNDEGFITDLIDENKYFDYIQFIEDSPTSIKTVPDFKDKDYNKLKVTNMLRYAKEEEEKGNFAEARRCYKNTADSLCDEKKQYYPIIEGMLNYARMCQEGFGGPVDMNEYLTYIKKAVECRDARAKYLYGLILEKGELVEKDLEEAVNYFKEAADFNHIGALHKIVKYLSEGIGVEQNIREALKYCKNPKIENTSRAKKTYRKLLHQINEDFTQKPQKYQKNLIIMQNGKIKYNGKEYFNDINLLFSGKESLILESDYLMKNGKRNFYPQGFKSCRELLQKQQEINGTVIKCIQKTKPKYTVFYFALPFDEGRQLFIKQDLQIEIDIINVRGKKDIYPQGRNYCLDLLRAELENGGVRVISIKKSQTCNVLYYFKSNFVLKYKTPKNSCPYYNDSYNEQIFYGEIREELNHKLEVAIARNKLNKYIFRDGFDECIRMINHQMENNAPIVTMINSDFKKKKTAVIHYDSKVLFERFCEEEYFISDKNELQNEIDKLKNLERDPRREVRHDFYLLNNKSIHIPQKRDRIIDLIQKQIENNGKIHFLRRKSNHSAHTWFYYNA